MGCYNSALIPASIDRVWESFVDFHDLSNFPNVVESVEPLGDKPGTDVGAARMLNGAFHETLVSIDHSSHTMRYSIDSGPGPFENDVVEGYVGEVRLFRNTDDDTTFVTWSSDWEKSNGGVADFCDPIYRALLADLKATFSQ